MRRIGILLFDDVEELDAVGPWEVFGAWAQAHPDEAEVVAFASQPGPVRGRLAGVERAKEIRRYIQYDPHPPV